MMKVGIFFNIDNYGGVQTCVLSLVKGLNQRGIIPDLICDRPPNFDIVEEFGVKLNFLPVRFSVQRGLIEKMGRWLQGASDLLYFFRTSWLKGRYDFLYIFQPNVIVDSEVRYLYYLSMSPRSPGFSGRRVLPALKFLAYDLLLKHFIPVYEFRNRADNCVINSKFTQALFEKAYRRRIEVVYPSITGDTYELGPIEGRSDILFFSRLVPEKRPELFINLASYFPALSFRLLGAVNDESYVADLQRLVQEKGVSNVTFFVNPSVDEVRECFRHCKVFVFTARNEHFGIATVEAMRYGALPLVHDSGGQREIVPFDQLRFVDGELVPKFKMLVEMKDQELSDLYGQVRNHVKEFREEVYIEKMLAFL